MAIAYSPPPAGAVAYTYPETCSVLSVGRDKIYDLVRKGDLKSVKVGRRSLVTATSVRNYLASIGVEVAA